MLPWRWGTGTGRTRGDKDGEMGMDGRRMCEDVEERDESGGRGEGMDMGELSVCWDARSLRECTAGSKE